MCVTDYSNVTKDCNQLIYALTCWLQLGGSGGNDEFCSGHLVKHFEIIK